MKIIQITRKKTYYEVAVESAVYEIDGELLRQNHIQEDEEINPETLEELHRKSRFRRAYRYACYLLDDRDYSYCMMYQKLMHTYQDKPLCVSVMEQLVQCGAVNDRRYAQKLTEYLVNAKHYGIYRIRQELLRKGIDKELTEQYISEFAEQALENLPVILEKKYARLLTDADDRKSIQKVIAGMSRLGYDYSDIKHAIEAHFQEGDYDVD